MSEGPSVDTWDGLDLQLERRIAFQVVHSSQIDDAGAQRAFERRVRLLAKVEHPNLMRVFDVLQVDETLVSIYEWIDGVVLEDLLPKRLSGWEAAVCVGGQLAAGLGALHEAGIIHRNVFPPNVMVTDHGFAKLTGGGRMRSILSDSTLTDQELLLIKTGYVAPERVADVSSSRDPSVDIYALGVILWEVATGRRVLELIEVEPGAPRIPRISADVGDVPASLDDLVFAATRPDAGERPPDGGAFAEFLTPLLPKHPEEVLASLID